MTCPHNGELDAADASAAADAEAKCVAAVVAAVS